MRSGAGDEACGRGAWRQRRKNKGGGKRDEDSARTHNGTEGGLAVGVMFVYVVRGGRSRRAESKGTSVALQFRRDPPVVLSCCGGHSVSHSVAVVFFVSVCVGGGGGGGAFVCVYDCDGIIII